MLPSRDPIGTDEGIVLRWFPVTDTSRIVVWFTRDHGKISTLLRGSQRAKSWMLGQYDLFYTCEVLFYLRAKDDLHILRECAPLTIRSGFRTNWQTCAGASFVSDLLYRLNPGMAPEPALYDLATRMLDELNADRVSPLHLFWFELHVYRAMGLSPNLEPAGRGPIWFNPRSGTLQEYSPGPGETEIQPATEGAVAIMRKLLDMKSPSLLSRLRPLPGQIQEIEGHLDRFSQWHLDLELPSRSHALRWITSSTAAA